MSKAADIVEAPESAAVGATRSALAPCHHGDRRRALLAAVGTSSQAKLGEASAALAGLTDPAALPATLGHACVSFGAANLPLCRPMFGQALPSGGDLPDELLQAIVGAREGLHGVIATGIADGTSAVSPDDGAAGRILSVAAWVVVDRLTLPLVDDIVERDQGLSVVAKLPTRVSRAVRRGPAIRVGLIHRIPHRIRRKPSESAYGTSDETSRSPPG